MYRFGLLSLCLLGIGGCSDFYLQSSPAPLSYASYGSATAVPAQPIKSAAASAVYTVKSGDTLYSIARQYNSSVSQLATHNGLSAPYRLTPGQRLQIASNASRPTPSYQARSFQDAPYLPGQFPSDCRVGGQWQWPVKNYQTVAAGSTPGLRIYGNDGQTIYAAASGKVMYSGPEPGLSGHYSNLIIIQHNSAYHSVYAGNRGVRVNEGAYVNAGQAIAEMGRGSHQRPLLQFEIRCRDKAVDPLRYLPRNE